MRVPIETIEQTIVKKLAERPVTLLYVLPTNIIDTRRLWQGRPVMRERQEIIIEEIGQEL